MSRPYIHITSATYSGGTLSLAIQAYHTRGGGPITISGLSSSVSSTVIGGSVDGTETITVNTGTLGTSSTATYTPPTELIWVFAGTSSTTTNAKPTFGSNQIASFTASDSVLSTFINGLAGAINNAANTYGVLATASSTALTLSLPNTGNYYNNSGFTLNLTKGSGGATVVATCSNSGLSQSGTFSNGSTNYNLVVSLPSLGYNNGTYPDGGDIITI